MKIVSEFFKKKQSPANGKKNTIKKKDRDKENGGKTNGNSEVYVCSSRGSKRITIKLQPIYSGILIGNIKGKKFVPV